MRASSVRGPTETSRVVELVAPPPQTSEWVDLARDDDVEDVLAIVGREDVRWHDLYHLLEIVHADVKGRMFSERRVTNAAVKRFTQTANSRRAIGGEAASRRRRRLGRKAACRPARAAPEAVQKAGVFFTGQCVHHGRGSRP